MFHIGWTELLLVLGLGLMLLGKQLAGVARSLGRALVEFRNGFRGIEEDLSVR
jgi:Sec-independent protein translocase protein TatA